MGDGLDNQNHRTPNHERKTAEMSLLDKTGRRFGDPGWRGIDVSEGTLVVAGLSKLQGVSNGGGGNVQLSASEIHQRNWWTNSPAWER